MSEWDITMPSQVIKVMGRFGVRIKVMGCGYDRREGEEGAAACESDG